MSTVSPQPLPLATDGPAATSAVPPPAHEPLEFEPRTCFSRRVSFNNLNPDNASPNIPAYLAHTQPNYTHTSNYGFGSSVNGDFAKLFANRAPPTPTSARKRLRLPDPPAKSILKNRLLPQQLQYNVQNLQLLGILFHGDLNDLVDSPVAVPLLDVGVAPFEFEEEAPRTRRKLYADMTDDELMALDPQFANTRSKVSNVDKFKFDSQKTYYLPAKRGLVLAPAPLKNLAVYPSSNENNYSSISLTVKHERYDALEIPPRTLLTVISGRKHTWNALDWLLHTEESPERAPNDVFLQNGDYLVVTALIPARYVKEFDSELPGRRKKGRCSLDSVLYAKCERLLQYVMTCLPSADLQVKITVELIPEPVPESPAAKAPGYKYMILHLYKQYQPTLVVVGNRSTNLNFKYPIRMGRNNSMVGSSSNAPSAPGLSTSPAATTQTQAETHYLIKLSSYIVKYSAIPVVVVGNATRFHHSPHHVVDSSVPKFSVSFSDLVPKNQYLAPVESPGSPRTKARHGSSSSQSDSIESFNGAIHTVRSLLALLSASAATEEGGVFADVPAKLDALVASGEEDRFKNMLMVVLDASMKECKTYLDRVGRGDAISLELLSSKVHQLYKSQTGVSNGSVSMGHRPSIHDKANGSSEGVYKVKSLILYSEEDEKKNEKLLALKKIKKQLLNNSSIAASENSSSGSDMKKKKKKSFFQKIGLKRT